MKRKYSKAMRIRVGELTQSLFEQAVREVVGDGIESEQDLQDTIADLRWAGYKDQISDMDDNIIDLQKQKKQVDDLYLNKLISLSDSQLQEIMICHNEGEIKRAPRTVEAILSEIAARSIFGYSEESESNNKYGGVDGTKEQGKRPSKKTNRTRSKTDSN